MARSMKTCPNCGYHNSKSLRQLGRQLRVEFGELPILEMQRRRWIAGDIHTPIPVLRDEIKRFFGLKSDEALTKFLQDGKTGLTGMACRIEPDYLPSDPSPLPPRKDVPLTETPGSPFRSRADLKLVS